MAINSVVESWEEVSVEQVAGLVGNTGSTTRTFTVDFTGSDSPNTEKMLAVDASKDGVTIPPLWEAHPYNAWWYVVRKTARRVKPHYYEVLVNYEYIENPLDQPPDISFDFIVNQEPVDFYYDDNGEEQPLTNSSGETFDPPINKEYYDLVIRIVRNQDYYNALVAAQYIGNINSDAIWGLAPGTVKCNVFSGQPKRAAQLYYYQVSYEFQVRFDVWRRRILDQGFREVTGVDEDGVTTYATILDDNLKPLSQPVLLDGDGEQLAESADPVFLERNLCRQLPFAYLQLPNL